MSETEPKLVTPRVTAAALMTPLHKLVLLILATRRHIRRSTRAGTLRLYDRPAVVIVRQHMGPKDVRQQAGRRRTMAAEAHAVNIGRAVRYDPADPADWIARQNGGAR